MSTEESSAPIEWKVYALRDGHTAFIFSFWKLAEAKRLEGQINRKYGPYSVVVRVTEKVWPTTIAWAEFRALVTNSPVTKSEVKDCSVEVWGRNTKWLKRLRAAGFEYNRFSQRWSRSGLTWNQAKSLAGRMRAEDMKVMLHGTAPKKPNSTVARTAPAPYKPTVSDFDLKRREEAAALAVNKSLAKRGRRARHKDDDARKSYETDKAGPDRSDRTP